jgi:hypothetical protein
MIIICCLPCLPVEIFWHLLTSLQRYICAYFTTRDRPPQLDVVLGQEASDWLRWCTMLSSACMSRAGLDGKWPDTQFHPTRIEQIGNWRDRRDSPTGRMSWEDHELKRMEPAGMEPLGSSDMHGQTRDGEAFRAEAESSGATWTGSPKGCFHGKKTT